MNTSIKLILFSYLSYNINHMNSILLEHFDLIEIWINLIFEIKNGLL